MSSRVGAILAFTMAAPLVYLYLFFLSWLIAGGVLPGVTSLEVFIFFTQLVRLEVVLSIGRLRRGPFATIWDIFLADAFSFPILGVLYLLSGNYSLVSLALTIIAIWPSGLLCVFPVVTIYRLTSNVWRGRSLMSVLPPAVGLFVALAFLAYVASSQPAPAGLEALSSTIVTALLQVRSAQIVSQVLVAGVPLYLSLLTYATMQGMGDSSRKVTALLLVASATLIAIAFAAFALYTAVSPVLVFGVPGSVIISAIWWMTRAR